jgi:hypothetical protein
MTLPGSSLRSGVPGKDEQVPQPAIRRRAVLAAAIGGSALASLGLVASRSLGASRIAVGAIRS